MSNIVDWMMAVYKKAKSGEFEWRPIYPNNMRCNGIEGVFTDMNFEKDGKYQYIKFSIEFQSRCDEEGTGHPEEGILYYILHVLEWDDLDTPLVVPEPTEDQEYDWDSEEHRLACSVNSYGRFRLVFSDLETAKKVVSSELTGKIYPYTYILSEEEGEQWNEFLSRNE